MKRDYYSSSIENFLDASPEEIVGTITINSDFAVEPTQRDAWLEEIAILKGTWAVSVSGNWRTTFRFEGGDAYDVDVEDYHS